LYITAGVQMRLKRKKRLQQQQQGSVSGHACSEDEESRDAERPMSWEGELSDAEMSRLDEAIVAGRGAVLAAAHLHTQQHLGVLQVGHFDSLAESDIRLFRHRIKDVQSHLV
jgi:hypothetical protein